MTDGILRLLDTSLHLMDTGREAMARVLLENLGEELSERNRLVETRLYPYLSNQTELRAENRRLEWLCRTARWRELSERLGAQLEREGQATALLL